MLGSLAEKAKRTLVTGTFTIQQHAFGSGSPTVSNLDTADVEPAPLWGRDSGHFRSSRSQEIPAANGRFQGQP